MTAKLPEGQAAAAVTFAAIALTVIGLFCWWLIMAFRVMAAVVGIIVLALLPAMAGILAGRVARLYRATALAMLASLVVSLIAMRWAGLDGIAWAAVSPIPILGVLMGVVISSWLKRLFPDPGQSQ
jgi:hypothetical protein